MSTTISSKESLLEQQRQEYKDKVLWQLLEEIFDEFDVDGSRSIDDDEFRSLLESLGKIQTDTEFQDSLKRIERNEEKQIGPNEFIQFMFREYPEFTLGEEDEDEYDTTKSAFTFLTRTGDDPAVNSNELKEIFRYLEPDVGEYDAKNGNVIIQKLMLVADKDQSNEIDFKEFRDMVNTVLIKEKSQKLFHMLSDDHKTEDEEGESTIQMVTFFDAIHKSSDILEKERLKLRSEFHSELTVMDVDVRNIDSHQFEEVLVRMYESIQNLSRLLTCIITSWKSDKK
jgi:Ca2+-binding EF-hand superfamily protein